MHLVLGLELSSLPCHFATKYLRETVHSNVEICSFVPIVGQVIAILVKVCFHHVQQNNMFCLIKQSAHVHSLHNGSKRKDLSENTVTYLPILVNLFTQACALWSILNNLYDKQRHYVYPQSKLKTKKITIIIIITIINMFIIININSSSNMLIYIKNNHKQQQQQSQSQQKAKTIIDHNQPSFASFILHYQTLSQIATAATITHININKNDHNNHHHLHHHYQYFQHHKQKQQQVDNTTWYGA